MTKNNKNVTVICEENCGNAPKKLLLLELMTHLVNGEISLFLEWLTDKVQWRFVGKHQLSGIEEVQNTLTEKLALSIDMLHIHHIITHGNIASLNGTLTLTNGDKLEFCHVYRFSGFGKKAKIKEITSYII